MVASRTNSTNVHAPFVYADSNSNVQKMYQVPKCFKFPQADRRQGWQFWLLGMPSCPATKNKTITHHAMLPFKKFNLLQLPSNMINAYKISWHPMFSMMKEGVNVEQCRSLSASDFINTAYKLGTNNIKRRASCI